MNDGERWAVAGSGADDIEVFKPVSLTSMAPLCVGLEVLVSADGLELVDTVRWLEMPLNALVT